MQAPFSLKDIPQKPGCYLYKNKDKKIIYIGKAKNLRKRVTSYFQKEHSDLKTRLLVKHIVSVDFFMTKTEVEALLLESNLIKKHKPKYNIELKDSKRYAYILVTSEKYPRILTARDKKRKGQYFGPFTSGYHRHVLIETLQKTFFIRTCRKLPKRACLRYHINLCKAPCEDLQSIEEYNQNVTMAVSYLKGKSSSVITKLEKQMKAHAKKMEYENAKLCKDKIEALSYLHERQIVETTETNYEDAINYVIKENEVYVLVFSVRNGILQDRHEFTLEYKEDFLEEFVKRYYEDSGKFIPKKILLPHALNDLSIASYLSEVAEKKVEIVVPQKGAKKELVTLVRKNLEEIRKAPVLAATQLKEKLNLESAPLVIECFDISHLSGTDTVASMVQFVNGKPNKAGYRRFKIQSVDGVDDFRSMHEVVLRRYKRLKKEGKEFPDLIVIDGGSQQLEFALRALDELGVIIPIIGLAKQFEEIYVPGKPQPLLFDKKLDMMKLLIFARDEAHRFGLKYQRLLRSKRVKKD